MEICGDNRTSAHFNWKFVWTIVTMTKCAAQTCENEKTKMHLKPNSSGENTAAMKIHLRYMFKHVGKQSFELYFLHAYARTNDVQTVGQCGNAAKIPLAGSLLHDNCVATRDVLQAFALLT